MLFRGAPAALLASLGLAPLACDMGELPHRSFDPLPPPALGPMDPPRDDPPPPLPPILAPVIHTGTIVPAKHPDRAACAPFQESTNASCVTGFNGPMIVTDVEFGSECPDELIVLAVSAGGESKLDVSRAHWYLLNPAHSHLSIHGAELAVEPTDELVFAARPVNGAATASAGSGCFVTWSSKGPANPASTYPRLE